jgi:hypothetical protein
MNIENKECRSQMTECPQQPSAKKAELIAGWKDWGAWQKALRFNTTSNDKADILWF